MRRRSRRSCVGALATCALLAACASMPPEIDEARDAYQKTAADPSVRRWASVELYDAEKAVEAAESSWNDDGQAEESAHLAYLATRRTEIAKLAAQRRAIEGELERLPAARERILLEARAAEADAATGRARAAQLEAQRLREQAVKAQAHATAASERAELLEKLIYDMGGHRVPNGGWTFHLQDVVFSPQGAEIDARARQNLDQMAALLQRQPSWSIVIEGHTDNVGTAAENDALSLQRAQAIADYLTSKGVASARIRAEGHGSRRPVTTNDTESGRQQNRRVELTVLPPAR